MELFVSQSLTQAATIWTSLGIVDVGKSEWAFSSVIRPLSGSFAGGICPPDHRMDALPLGTISALLVGET